MDQIVVAVFRSVFLAGFLLAPVIWPAIVYRRSMQVVALVLFAASLIVIPAGMLYFEMTWDAGTYDLLGFLSAVRFAHLAVLVGSFAFGIASVCRVP